MSRTVRNAAFSLLLAVAACACGQQGPLVLPEDARPIERLENPPSDPATRDDDEQPDER